MKEMAIKMPNMWSFECIVILTTVHTIFKDISEIKGKIKSSSYNCNGWAMKDLFSYL